MRRVGNAARIEPADQVPFLDLAAGEVSQRHRDGLKGGLLQDGDGKQKLVPYIGELPDDDRPGTSTSEPGSDLDSLITMDLNQLTLT